MRSFNEEVCLKIGFFLDKYSNLLEGVTSKDIPLRIGVEALKFLISILKKNKKNMYLIIDEYDNFANRVMFSDEKIYYNLSHDDGDIKTFFATIKSGAKEGNGIIAKIFMTGVTPILLDDLTSGANIFTNATLDFRVNSMLGFTENEVDKILDDFKVEEIIDKEYFKNILKDYTNGYKFNEEVEETLYNTDMVLYLIKSLFDRGKLPKGLIDENVKTDYTRIRKIAENFDTEGEISNIVKNDTETKPISIISKFSLESLKDESARKDKFYSLLFYLGLLTIKEDDGAQVILKIPNQSIRNLFLEYIGRLNKLELSTDIQCIQNAIKEMCKKGNVENLMNLYRKIRYERVDSDDMKHYNELDSKLIMLMLMGISSLYQIFNEKKLNQKYCDIYLREAPNYDYYVKYRYVIEFKHVSKGKKTKKEIENDVKKSMKEAKEQIEVYCQDQEIIDSKKLIKKLAIVTIGREEEVYEIY